LEKKRLHNVPTPTQSDRPKSLENAGSSILGTVLGYARHRWERERRSHNELVATMDNELSAARSRTAANGSVILETRSLTRRFGLLTAVDDLSISVKSGETFGLLGSNGAGKSTLIKMLTTLLPPTSGEATIAGFDVARQSSRVRREIGYVPQMGSVDGALTARENLEVFAKLYSLSRQELGTSIPDALKYSGLTEVSDRLVNTFSGGMSRRLEIAISTLHRPRLLFLDEPTAGLDPVARNTVWARIQDLRKTMGMTIFLTTHYMDEAESLCNRIAIMHAGKVAAIGTPDELKSSIGSSNATMDDVFIYYSAQIAVGRGG
jgi:ABC-2 type transport system ATP-binding protein